MATTGRKALFWLYCLIHIHMQILIGQTSSACPTVGCDMHTIRDFPEVITRSWQECQASCNVIPQCTHWAWRTDSWHNCPGNRGKRNGCYRKISTGNLVIIPCKTDGLMCGPRKCVVNGAWGDWSRWSACSKPCDSGRKQRTRSCNNPRPSDDGMECNGRSTDNELCNTKECVINGGWGEWGEWSACSQTCGIGRSQRKRSCDNPRPSGGGSRCSGDGIDSAQCNTKKCLVNGGWSDWREWSACSKTCGIGRRQRKRRCNNPTPEFGGSRCSGRRIDKEQCNTKCVVNGAWGDWSRWGTCSKTCGGGSRQRKRSCNNPRPSNGGRKCSRKSTDNVDCNTQECVYGCIHGHGYGHGYGCYEHEDSAETYEVINEDKGGVDHIADSAETYEVMHEDKGGVDYIID